MSNIIVIELNPEGPGFDYHYIDRDLRLEVFFEKVAQQIKGIHRHCPMIRSYSSNFFERRALFSSKHVQGIFLRCCILTKCCVTVPRNFLDTVSLISRLFAAFMETLPIGGWYKIYGTQCQLTVPPYQVNLT